MGYVEVVVRREGSFQRLYARKRLHTQHRDDDGFRAMFLDEARVAGLVRHPNVVSVLDVGQDADGPYIIMEFVEGVTAARLIAATHERGEAPPVQIAVRIALEAALGLHAAHETTAADGAPLGLVHRDVSAQNVLVGFDGHARVTDFGIAKALGNSTRTTTGMLKGNMGYIAPEQLRFEPVDRRADLFSLGVVLYELLAGERLYENREDYDGPRRILNEPPPDIGDVRDDVPPELTELLFELLAKERDRRPATAQAIATRLEAVLAALVDEDGPLEVGEFVTRRFDDVRQEQQARLAAALEEAQSRTAPGRPRARVIAAAALALLAASGALVLGRRAAGPQRPATPGAGRPGEAHTVWAGGWHTCALDGETLLCWGKNNSGQLGVGTSIDYDIARPVAGLRAPVAMALGFFHTCACARDGQLYCWGSNADGQLGLPDTTERRSPTAVPAVRDCVDVGVGPYHTCVVRRNGAVACFGRDDRGQAGQPATETVRVPATVAGIDDALAVDGGGRLHDEGGNHRTCVLRRTGAVMCFGDNLAGSLGDGTTEWRYVPAPVSGLADAVEIAVGGMSACARRRGGTVVCWGANDEGQLGDGSRSPHATPVLVPGIDDAVQIGAGLGHACALRRTGELRCWGSGGRGELGDGSGRNARTPVVVADIQGFVSIGLGDRHTCGRHASGIACWGLDQTGQLGAGLPNVDRRRPVSSAGFKH
jgi:serine/threonine-protein kinase